MRQGHAVRPYDREVWTSSLEQRRSVKGGSRQRQREGRVAPGSDVQGTVRANGIHIILFGFKLIAPDIRGNYVLYLFQFK